MLSPLHFVDSQDEEEMQLEPVVSPARAPTSINSIQSIAQSIKSAPLGPDSRKTAASQISPTPSRRGVKTTPKARLRHDDSQIQFAAIESSPLQPELIESQSLTDRQKEVKERQGREAAAMFPEIRSSPRSTSRPPDYVLPKLLLKCTQDPASKSATNEDTSPSYLPDALMNEFLGSSPTPSSKRSSDRRSDNDLPSSSPFVSPSFHINQLTDASLVNEDHAPVIANTREYAYDHFADERIPSVEGYPSNSQPISVVEDDLGPSNDQEDASNLKTPQVAVGAYLGSDPHIHVDAPSVPSLNNSSSTEHDDNQSNDIANSYQGERSSHFSVEHEQVDAQLFTEMERASQQSANKEEIAQSSQGVSKKRKRPADSPKKDKKMRHTPASSDLQPAVEVPRTGETVADCVMVVVRESDRSRPVLPQQIKRELSASPSVLTSGQAIEETPMMRETAVDHPMNTEVIQSSRQGQDTPSPMTAKKAIGRPRGSRNSQVKREEAEDEQARALRKGTRVSKRLSESATSSPHMSPAGSQESTQGGQWLALGKTPRRGMFQWLRRSSAESEDFGTPKPTSFTNEQNAEGISERSKVQDSQRNDLSPGDDPEKQIASHNEDHELVSNQHDGEPQPENSGCVETEREPANAQGILQGFRNMLDSIKRVTFGPEEERAAVGMLFECVKEVHEAGRRQTSM